MAKVKLDLRGKTDAEILALAKHHVAEMTGNANFPNPIPTAAEFDALVQAAEDSLTAVEEAYTAWRQLVADKDAKVIGLKNGLTARAGYVDSSSGGDEVKVLSTGFSVQSPKSPIGLPAQPGNLIAKMGSLEGTIELDWDNVRGALTYIVECRLFNDGAAWEQAKIVTRSDATLIGLTPGQTYAFRVRAVGSAGEGPWSDLATMMAP